MKAKSRGYKADLAFSGVFVFCCLFFIAGFFTSNLFSQEEAYGSRQRRRVVETVDSEFTISHGETGDGSISMIPFQVISWKPRAFYFPNFATAEQCQGIINMAKAKLQPSHVLLPKGGTGQANEIRTRHSMCCGMKLDRNTYHIMMRLIQSDMALKRAKGLQPSCSTYQMFNKEGKLFFHMRMA